LKDGRFYVKDTVELLYTDLNRMAEFAMHLRDGRGDFFHKGQLGKDFHVYYNGNELQYKKRQIYYKGKKLDNLMQMRINDSADTATSYLYVITFLHLLHIIGTLLYMLRMSIRSFTANLEEHNYLSIRTGAIFWHFLGVLWLYLLLFLLFIH
jgi:cytochrome c oxidase subunit III